MVAVGMGRGELSTRPVCRLSGRTVCARDAGVWLQTPLRQGSNYTRGIAPPATSQPERRAASATYDVPEAAMNLIGLQHREDQWGT
jgi:hypothetical protein